jgi:drug/metabolite transporter (DMT)-like permease
MKPSFARWIFVLAIFAVGAAAPLARLADGVNPISIGFWRVTMVGLMMLLWSGRPQLPRLQMTITLMASVCLAGHFWLWFESIEHTTIVRSTVLVCLNPLWVGLWEWFQERTFNRNFWLGTVLAIVGASLMTVDQSATAGIGFHIVYGDLLALGAGILGSVYLICSKSVRETVDIYPYTSVLCLSTGAILLGCAGWNGVDVVSDFSLAPWVLIAMALGPQLFGHVGLTWSLEWLSAGTIALGLLLEPVGAGVLAWLWFDEVPTLWEWLGAVLILGGVWMGTKQDVESGE